VSAAAPFFDVTVTRSGREEITLRLGEDAPEPAERDALRIEADAEKAVRAYARAREVEADEARDFETAQEWAAIGPRCLAPLLCDVPSSPFSRTWRDLFAWTVLEARDPVTISGEMHGEDVLEIHAPKKKLPPSVRPVSDEETFGAGEAHRALEELAAVLPRLPLLGEPAADLDAHLSAHAKAEYKAEAKKPAGHKRTRTALAAALARTFGIRAGAVKREGQRERKAKEEERKAKEARQISGESVAPIPRDLSASRRDLPNGDDERRNGDAEHGKADLDRGRCRAGTAQAANTPSPSKPGRGARLHPLVSVALRLPARGPRKLGGETQAPLDGRPRPRPRGVKRKRE
jgi:hypothetical protein